MCEIFTAHTEILLVLKQKQFSVYCLACDDKYEFIIMQDKKKQTKNNSLCSGEHIRIYIEVKLIQRK